MSGSGKIAGTICADAGGILNLYSLRENAVTKEDWWKLANSRRNTAVILLENRQISEAYEAMGLAIEFALKAVYAKQRRPNEWPDRAKAPYFYHHNLMAMARRTGILPPTADVRLSAKFHAICGWTRDIAYSRGRLDPKHVRKLHDDAFGRDGVFEWLKTL